MRLEIFANSEWLADAECDVRLEPGDELRVPSKRRIQPGSSLEQLMLRVIRTHVRFESMGDPPILKPTLVVLTERMGG